ncbi:hypothetical protein M9Y10_015939 [Tritrichomonas musculus]|uniref:SPK domain-containing protein n=1 Tax=Tritrichomonas musculus TaxID=1915356 RepID=A0ABR2I4Y6_9EUKA
MPVDIQFMNKVASELQMTAEDMQKFPEPENFNEYCRSIIYGMSKTQFRLLKSIADFPRNVTKVKHMKRVLIMYIQKYPQFEGCNFNEIWCRFAHSAYISRRKVQIKEFGFENGRKVEALEFSFSNIFNPIGHQTRVVEETPDDNDEVGPEIQFLSRGIRNLSIQ